MNKIIYLASFLFLMNCSSNVFADSFIVKLNFLDGEKSKDRWTSETTVSIDGSEIKYKKTWSGSAKGRNKDVDKQKGFMTEALEAVLDFGFKELHLHRIQALVYPQSRL